MDFAARHAAGASAAEAREPCGEDVDEAIVGDGVEAEAEVERAVKLETEEVLAGRGAGWIAPGVALGEGVEEVRRGVAGDGPYEQEVDGERGEDDDDDELRG